MTAAAAVSVPRRQLGLTDRPIRGKLAVWATVPVAAIVALALLIGVSGASDASEAGQALRLVSAGETAGELMAQLQLERAAAASVFGQSSRPAAIEAYRTQAEATDAVVARFLAGQQNLNAPTGLEAPLQRLDTKVAALPLLREQVRSGQDATGSLTIFRYRALTADLGGYRAGLSQLGEPAARPGPSWAGYIDQIELDAITGRGLVILAEHLPQQRSTLLRQATRLLHARVYTPSDATRNARPCATAPGSASLTSPPSAEPVARRPPAARLVLRDLRSALL